MRHAIEEAEAYITKNFGDPELSVKKVCDTIHMSYTYFSDSFKRYTGETYCNYLKKIRMYKAVELLEKTNDCIYKIAFQVGYKESNYFTRVFTESFGISPQLYRKRGSADQ